MKIGLICRGRTFSSAIIESLSNDNNLLNYGEQYFTCLNTANKINNLKHKWGISHKFETFETCLLSYTTKLFQTDNFVCKLWPTMLLYRDTFDIEVSLDYVKDNFIFNITKYWNLKDYDKLYFLDRDLITSTYSWVYAKHKKFFNLNKTQNAGEIYTNITINDSDINLAKLYILEYCLQHKMKKFLIENNFNIIEVDNHNNLINQSSVPIIASNQNYTKLINNYNILDNLFTDYLPYCQNKIDDWKFY